MQQGKRAPPKLDLRAFQAPPTPSRRNHPDGLVDTHIHLWTQEQLATGRIKWPVREGGLPQLSGPHELDAYGAVVEGGMQLVGGGKSEYRGVVFVQAECVLLLTLVLSSVRADLLPYPQGRARRQRR